LIDLLEERAAKARGYYHFLQDGKITASELSYSDLAQQARAIARQLQQQTTPGSRALLLYPPGLAFLPAFFGCLYAGVVAVPIPLPDTARLKRTLPRFQAVIEDAEPALALTTAATATAFETRRSDFVPGIRWLATDEIEPDSKRPPAAPAPKPESLAYLQYTSGSTAMPRGVMLTHANVLHNLGYLRSGLAYDGESISVTWMPYFHDFGLVDGLLQPLYSNIPCYVLSPLTVLKRPLLWLQAIDRYRATHSHGPNFAYEMCLQRITLDQRKSLNLSSWRVAANGAEPIRSETLRRFSEAFAPCGFRPEAFYPGYGLAEATLFVTVRRHDASSGVCALESAALEQHRVVPLEPHAASAGSRTVVSCGAPQGVMQVRIVDPEIGRICPPDRVGEIWLADPSVAAGYWRKPQESLSTFQAYLADEPSAGPFLRTGDLGFLRAGELYVTGRLKDLIIIGGVNHYPQDIEWTVQSHCPELRRDHCAAFSIDGPDAEQLVFVAEPEYVQSDWQPLLERIREVIATYHDISPAAVVLLKRGGMYKTSSGKLQRSACRQAFREGGLHTLATWQPHPVTASASKPSQPTVKDLHRWLCEELAARLQIRPDEIDPHTSFAAYGLDSRSGVALIAALEDRLGGPELSPTLLWQYPNVAALSRYLSQDNLRPRALDGQATENEPVARTSESLAIVGMACRFPGASSPHEFWALLREGRSAIVSSPRLPGIEAGFLATVEDFDAEFFGISVNEAQAMDPQQRLLLEVAWEAIENAGLPPQHLAGLRGGIFIGISAADYGFRQFSQPDAAESINAHSGSGLAFSIAANRLSYHFNLCGPSMAIDTACSSSLVAVHQACQSLNSGECDLALAGGVNLILSPYIQLALERAGMLSPSRRCKTFDADADGYVRGEGCGIVVLKRLSAAQRDGDTVLALIRASAANQDGRSNGLTAPNPLAQQALIRQALAQAGLTANAIDYIETHGTGTRLGDPIEMSALQAVLGDGRRATERCWVGSVKTNIGHLEAAAGIAGLIKTVLSLQHAEVPPHLNLQRLNPLIKLADTPFAIANNRQPWPQNADEQTLRPRRAAVSSFGFGGTNAHVILEQAPCELKSKLLCSSLERPAHLFTLSAQSPMALRELAGRYATYLKTQPDKPLADLCFTTSVCRAHFVERLALPATSSTVLAAHLQAFSDGARIPEALSGHAATQPPRVVFLFSGQGSQYVGMARQLYETQPRFRAILQECDALIRDDLERPLLSVIFGDAPELIDQTAYTQPALFAVEYALARLWQQWGIEPAAVMGHSLGEYVAACLAGVFSLRDGVRLVAARGRLMQQLPQDGTMLVVLGDEVYLSEAIRDYSDAVSIAAVNAPQNVVLSGDRLALGHLHGKLLATGLTCRFLNVSHAFHSPLMAPILEEFRAVAAELDYAPPRLTWISNLDGKPITKAPDADYWTRHLRDSVRFADGIRWLGESHRVFVEIGPSPVLSHLGAQCLADPQVQWLASLRPKADDWNVMVNSLARLYVAGVMPDWQGFDRDYARRRLGELPNYPFRRQRFALPPQPAGVAVALSAPQVTSRGGDVIQNGASLDSAEKELTDITDWGYVPQWQPAPPAIQVAPTEWLLLADTQGVGAALQALLKERGQACSLGTDMLPEPLPLGLQASEPLQVVCLWGLDWPPAAALDMETLPSLLERIVSRLLSLLHQVANQSRRSIRLWLISRAAIAMADENAPEVLDGLLQSVLWGLGRSLRAEYPDWQIRLVELSGEKHQAANQLLQECLAADIRTEVCWRGQQRYAWRLQPHRLETNPASPPLGDTWLITGGLGRLGVKMAEWLVQQGVHNLLLIGRHRPNPQVELRLAELSAQGATLEVRMLDVCDYVALRELLTERQSGWPPLQGVIHAAGVLDDSIVHKQTPARFNAVLAPKVLGSWYLHLLTGHLPLRHFILFSSASGLLGNPGQSAYAAANAFLDALAGYRHARGLAALSLNWSAWAESTEDPKVARQLERHGLGPIASDQGLAVLQRVLGLDLPQIALLPRMAGQTVDHIQPMEPSSAQAASKSKPVAVGLLQRLRHDAPEDRQSKLRRHILELAASILGGEPTALDPQRGFFDQGLDSLNVVELRNRLQRDLVQPLPITLPFNFPTVTTLADELLQQFGLAAPNPVSARPARLPEPLPARTEDIAIIGMGCRLPGGVSSPEAFWVLLRDGIDAISEVPPDRWDVDSYYHPDPDHPGTIVTRYGGFVDGVEQFDAVFFGISPREAHHLDPQQRLLLEVCWETLEHAGVPPSSLLGTQTGVFIGISTNDYLQRLNRRPEEIDAYLGTGNALSLAANRLSYTFGLEGPSLAIDTACSSSLVAIHQACQSLRSGESDIAIGGGVNLLLDPTVSINHSRAHMLAPDGRCKAFSAAADGMVRAEGCGLVLLKRLSDALRDGDPILAIIRGSAVNQDGRTSGLTVPNGPAQQRVIRRALHQAALEPAAISYVEAHGTGTPLGDPIEAEALTSVFGGTRKRLTMGSVKTNIGHLESAAGVAGVMKIVLALQHRMIPAHLHCESLDPQLDWAESPLRIPSATENWLAESGPRRAGVSSFGFGGTNAHVILEEAPPLESREIPALSRYMLPLSAKTETALRDLARRYVVYLETTSDSPADICYTAACGRDHFVQRIAVLGDTVAALRSRLNAWLNGETGGDIWFGSVAPAKTTERTPDHTPQATTATPADWAAMAGCYAQGVGPDWAACYHGLKLHRVLLPGHPFERQTYSVNPPVATASRPQCYQLHWTLEPDLPPPSEHSDHWLILADGRGWGEVIAAELESHGGRCTIVYRAPAVGGRRSLSSDDHKGMRALLEETGRLHGVVHLWGLDNPSPSDLDADNLLDAQRHSLGSVLHLVRALNDLPQPPRVWLLSQAAQAVVPGDRLEGLAQTALWGLGRSVALEMSRLWGGLLDLPAEVPTPQQAAAVCAALYGPAEDSQRALRAGRFYVPRLRPWAPEHRHNVTIRPDASYLITGGFGSLGRQLGRWLVQQGARSLWLMGRRGATDAEAGAYLEELHRLGVTTQVGTVDVADAAALAARLAEWQRLGPPLRGVVHAAGLNGQTPLASLDWPAFATVLAPKLQGTWALQHNTADLELDFFVACSSIAGLWGGQGQAAYCAANAFLDGFAAYRQAHGRAALSVNWGPLSDSAMVDEAAAAELRSYGIYPTPLARSTAELLPLLSDGAAQVVCVAVDWSRFVPLYQSRCATGFFSTLPVSSLAPTIGRPEVAVKAAVQTDWPTALRTWLTEQLSSTLGLTPQQLDADVPLPSLGLDSLMAVELRNRLQRQLGREVPLPDLLGDMSLNDLVAILVGTQIAPVVKPLEPAGQSKWVIGEI
jgi:acyl transferase domain-containing protein/acyl-CoA synthetase (AMP-forming)/AMP-acid ligase II/acyl carrier protein